MSRNPISSCERTKLTDRNIESLLRNSRRQYKKNYTRESSGLIDIFFFCPQLITDGNVFVNTSFIEVVYQLVPS